jgi:hypothetical protein
VIAATGTRRIADHAPPQFSAGPITLPPAGLPNDHGLLFAVKDNGSGPSASGPDQFTAVIHTTIATAGALCANPALIGGAQTASSFANDVDRGYVRAGAWLDDRWGRGHDDDGRDHARR